MLVSLLLTFEACYFIKTETLAQLFSCEFCEIPKNTFLHVTPPVVASELIRKGLDPKQLLLKKFFFSCRLLCLIAGNSFLQSAVVFLYFTKVVDVIHSPIGTVLFRRTLAAMNCVYRIYTLFFISNAFFQLSLSVV